MAEMKDRPYEEVDSLVQFYIRMSLEGNPFALGIIAGMVDAGNLEPPDDVIKKIQAKLDGLGKGERMIGEYDDSPEGRERVR